MKFRLSPIALAVLAIHALPVAAQQSPPPPAPASEEPAKDQATQLREVKVQAEAPSEYKVDNASSPKYTAPLRDTPKSVTVIPAQVLKDNAATSLQDALRTVPGITFLAGEGGQALADRPVIRGLNSTADMYVDGVRDIGTQTRDVFALESVEVIKGADSAYGGRASGGGSVNLVTKQAKAEEFTNATIMLGTADTIRGTVDKNWKINDTTALRLNVMGNSGNVPGRDNAVDYDKWGAAGALAFGLGTPTRIMLDYYHLTDDGMPDYSMPYDPRTGTPVTESMGVDSKRFYGLVNRDFRNSEADIGTVKVEHDLDGGMVVRNVTRLGRSLNDYVVSNPDDSSGNVPNGFVYRSSKNRWAQSDTVANVTDLTGKLSTGFIEHSFDIGAEFNREKRDQDGYTVTARTDGGTARVCTAVSPDCADLYNPDPNAVWTGTVSRNHAPTHYETEAIGVYAFDTLSLTEQWQVNLGLRWDSYETEAKRAAGTNSSGAAVTAISASSEDDFVNYQLGLVFKPIEAGSIYASYSTATTPAPLGAADEDAVSSTNLNWDPERSATAEIGTKWEFFDRNLLLTLALFDTERKDAYILVDATTYQKVGKTRVRGVEFSFTGNITKAWQVFGGYSYLDSELVKGALVSSSTTSEIVDPSQGKQLPNTPENSFSLFTTYEVVPKLKVGGGAYYVSKVYGNTATTRTIATGALVLPKYVPDYWRFDANASYEINRNFSVQLNVQNLTDEVYYTKAYSTHG
ncbi:MAG: TonB-dependent receptor, partial [Solimonas sp.]